MYQTQCPSCQHAWTFGEQYAGGKGACPKCEMPVLLPTEDRATATLIPGATKKPPDKCVVAARIGCHHSSEVTHRSGSRILEMEHSYRTVLVQYERPDEGNREYSYQCPFCGEMLTITVGNEKTRSRRRLTFVIYFVVSAVLAVFMSGTFFLASRRADWAESTKNVLGGLMCVSVIGAAIGVMLAPIVLGVPCSLSFWIRGDAASEKLGPRAGKHAVFKP